MAEEAPPSRPAAPAAPFPLGVYWPWERVCGNAERLKIYLMLLLVMQGGLMGVFASVDIFYFYFFHELALIPTFIMVGLWGTRGATENRTAQEYRAMPTPNGAGAMTRPSSSATTQSSR